MKHACKAIFISASMLLASTAVAQSEHDIVRVHEDWVLQVGEAVEPTNSPQITMTMFPSQESESEYAQFFLNYQNATGFTPGGMELVLLQGEDIIGSAAGPSSAAIESTGETVSWTMSMKVEDGELVLRIINGHSATWGAFGGGPNLRISKTTELSHLNSYSPWYSWHNSGASLGANRVHSLQLTGGRKFKRNGDVIHWSASP